MTDGLADVTTPIVDAETSNLDRPLSLGAASWSLFEGARIPYVLLITIYIFMPYLASTVVGDPVRGQEMVSRWSQYSGWAVMLTAPFLGASIDKLGPRKMWLGLIVAIMIPLIALLWFTKADHSGLSATAALAIAAVVGTLFTWSEVLQNSLLIRAAGLGGAHKASGLALALGNAFGVATLAFTAWAFALPGLPATTTWGWLPKAPLFGLQRSLHEPERVVALLAAGVFALGILPFFLFTPDAPRTGIPVFKALREGARELGRMVRTVRENRDAAIYLASRMFYVDGMTAILIYSGIYAAGVMKWQALELLIYGIILSVLAVLGGFVGRWLDHGVGPKNAVRIEIGMSLLGIIAILGMGPERILYFWHWSAASHAPLWNGPFFRTLPEWIFLAIGFSNAVFITGHYASSRTLLTRLTPSEKTGAYFGVYALSGTATSWLGPLLVNQGTHLFKTQQGGFATVILLLAIGFVGLLYVRGGGQATGAVQSMIRLYVDQDLAAGVMIPLRHDQTHYLVNVMRQGEGAQLHLFNGRDGEWIATLVEARKKVWAARVENQVRPWSEGRDLDLVVAVVKRGRLETIVEKAAELGARRVLPVLTERTNVARVGVDRLRAIAIEAAEQTGRIDVPTIVDPAPLARVLAHLETDRRLMFCDEAGDALPAAEALAGEVSATGPWAILIGPEGGFSPAERATVRVLPGSLPVSLGPRILRADTAAIAALTLWQSALGDWRAS